jgi:hypothetical protein
MFIRLIMITILMIAIFCGILASSQKPEPNVASYAAYLNVHTNKSELRGIDPDFLPNMCDEFWHRSLIENDTATLENAYKLVYGGPEEHRKFVISVHAFMYLLTETHLWQPFGCISPTTIDVELMLNLVFLMGAISNIGGITNEDKRSLIIKLAELDRKTVIDRCALAKTLSTTDLILLFEYAFKLRTHSLFDVSGAETYRN